MKPTIALLIAGIICASVARAGDVKVEVVIAVDQTAKPATTFTSDTPKLYAFYKTKGLQNGDKVRGVWIGEDVGDAAPKETKIYERTVIADGDTDDGEFSLSKPTAGWPVGKYRVEIYVGDNLITTVKFKIHAPLFKKDAADGESSEE
ncbi:MAG TPA: hypothetical protein VGQ95_03390 [Chthoniobacterales bacterium]|nr:hypothetical protein [Chthoniobacterales bacterium]